MDMDGPDYTEREGQDAWIESAFGDVDACLRKIAAENMIQQSVIRATEEAREKLSSLQKAVLQRLKELQQKVEERYQIIKTSDLSPLTYPWVTLGSGNFGEVFKAKYMGTSVAVKVMKPGSTRSSEEFILRGLSHENIVAFRGIGTVEEVPGLDGPVRKHIESHFIVMEYIPEDLDDYVKKHVTDESAGLSYGQAWDVGQQIASALSYLHALDIAHRDLKPDNILVSRGPVIKLADFGLAWRGKQLEQIVRIVPTSSGTGSSRSGYVNIRWGAPELLQGSSSEESMDSVSGVDYFQADMYTFAHVLAYTVTGERPSSGVGSSLIGDVQDIPQPISLPVTLKGALRTAIEKCYNIKPSLRPLAHDVIYKLLDGKNPYRYETSESLFFSCGFLDNTYIYVADSCIGESTEGFYKTGTRPEGYSHESLICDVNVHVSRECPEKWEITYREQYLKFIKMAKDKEIDDNPAVALKEIILARPGEEEKQVIELCFQQTTYCHHRAMREVWKTLDEKERREEVPGMADVHPHLSTSFGLHVAVLTNEGPDEPPMFIFCRRNRVKGMATPGRFTCGAVESVSAVDYKHPNSGADGTTKVSLVNTAARGLKEELGLELTDEDAKAVTLATFYLKFDTHEWGLCGFVDLRDERILPDHRISAKNLITLFTSGPKDKFEHQSITPVKFELESMVDFVENNFEYFASSTKLVVVKVLQAFFGVTKVESEFAKRSNISNQ